MQPARWWTKCELAHCQEVWKLQNKPFFTQTSTSHWQSSKAPTNTSLQLKVCNCIEVRAMHHRFETHLARPGTAISHSCIWHRLVLSPQCNSVIKKTLQILLNHLKLYPTCFNNSSFYFYVGLLRFTLQLLFRQTALTGWTLAKYKMSVGKPEEIDLGGIIG